MNEMVRSSLRNLHAMRTASRLLVLLLAVCAFAGCATPSPSHSGMGLLAEGDRTAAYQTFLECGKRGDPSCINNLGSMFESGTNGVGKDMDSAVRHYVLAARFGSPAGQGNLTRLGIQLPAVDLLQPDAKPGELSPEAAQTLAIVAEVLGEPDARR